MYLGNSQDNNEYMTQTNDKRPTRKTVYRIQNL